MRTALLLAVALGSTGCVNSAFYQPGQHTYAVLDQPRDMYVAAGKGSATSRMAGETAVTRDLEIAYALGPVVLLTRASEARTDPGFGGDDDWIRQTQLEVGVGRLARTWEDGSIQDLLVVSRASSDAAQHRNPDFDPSYRAHGKYWRVYAQRTAMVRRTLGDAALSLRLSAVHADRFQRLGRSSGNPGDYGVVLPDSGSRTGVFLEPGFTFRVGYKGVKFGPSISAPYRLKRTAYAVNAVSLSVNLSVSIDPQRPRR